VEALSRPTHNPEAADLGPASAAGSPGLALPERQQVVERESEPWDWMHPVIDTALTSAARSVEIILEQADDLAVPPC
jgi:hypothetical protein